MNRWISRSKQYAADCAHAPHSALFRHVKTVDNARDMDSLRKALGQKQINFYGFSYGTYLGQVYATLYPNRVRRFVLDSNVDPRNGPYRDNQLQDIAFQRTFNIYFKWVAKYHTVYHLGRTFRAVRHNYLSTVARLNKHAPAASWVGTSSPTSCSAPATTCTAGRTSPRHGSTWSTCTVRVA